MSELHPAEIIPKILRVENLIHNVLEFLHVQFPEERHSEQSQLPLSPTLEQQRALPSAAQSQVSQAEFNNAVDQQVQLALARILGNGVQLQKVPQTSFVAPIVASPIQTVQHSPIQTTVQIDGSDSPTEDGLEKLSAEELRKLIRGQ